MAYSLSNKCAKNLCKRPVPVIVQQLLIIKETWSHVFGTQCSSRQWLKSSAFVSKNITFDRFTYFTGGECMSRYMLNSVFMQCRTIALLVHIVHCRVPTVFRSTVNSRYDKLLSESGWSSR